MAVASSTVQCLLCHLNVCSATTVDCEVTTSHTVLSRCRVAALELETFGARAFATPCSECTSRPVHFLPAIVHLLLSPHPRHYHLSNRRRPQPNVLRTLTISIQTPIYQQIDPALLHTREHSALNRWPRWRPPR